MHSRTLLNMLVVGLSTFAAVEANVVDVRLAAQNGAIIQKRQNTDDTVNGASTTSSSTPPPSSPPPATTTPTSTSRSSTTSVPTTSSPRPTSTPPPQTTPPPATPSSTPSSDGDELPQTSESYTTITSYITTTDGNGAPTTITTQSTSTATPGLAGNGNNGGSGSNMSKETRNTIIGVVVGVGGAIILGGLAFVAWRIWGRKKAAEEPDDLMDYPSSAGEKPDTVASNSMSGRTPFQSTLESYHAPTQVNTASNF